MGRKQSSSGRKDIHFSNPKQKYSGYCTTEQKLKIISVFILPQNSGFPVKAGPQHIVTKHIFQWCALPNEYLLHLQNKANLSCANIRPIHPARMLHLCRLYIQEPGCDLVIKLFTRNKSHRIRKQHCFSFAIWYFYVDGEPFGNWEALSTSFWGSNKNQIGWLHFFPSAMDRKVDLEWKQYICLKQHTSSSIAWGLGEQ